MVSRFSFNVLRSCSVRLLLLASSSELRLHLLQLDLVLAAVFRQESVQVVLGESRLAGCGSRTRSRGTAPAPAAAPASRLPGSGTVANAALTLETRQPRTGQIQRSEHANIPYARKRRSQNIRLFGLSGV